jgi:hypothetical protein
MAAGPKVTGVTFADLARLEDARAEIIHGSIVETAILSPSSEKRDLVDKVRVLRESSVPHRGRVNGE